MESLIGKTSNLSKIKIKIKNNREDFVQCRAKHKNFFRFGFIIKYRMIIYMEVKQDKFLKQISGCKCFV